MLGGGGFTNLKINVDVPYIQWQELGINRWPPRGWTIDYVREREGGLHKNAAGHVSQSIRNLMIERHGLLANLRDRDNLSTVDKTPTPSVSVVWRFHCT